MTPEERREKKIRTVFIICFILALFVTGVAMWQNAHRPVAEPPSMFHTDPLAPRVFNATEDRAPDYQTTGDHRAAPTAAGGELT